MKTAEEAIATILAALVHSGPRLYPCASTAVMALRCDAARYRAAGAPILAALFQTAAERIQTATKEDGTVTLESVGMAVPEPSAPPTVPEASPPPKAAPRAKPAPAIAHDDGLGF